MKQKALVVLSGGQDSTTCLFWAIGRWGVENVEAVLFDYGQRHAYEMDCAMHIADMADVKLTVLPINTFAAMGGTALTDANMAPQEAGSTPDGQLPSTFVPGRNLIFMTFAGSLAYMKGISNLVTGVCETDYSGYPDCRDNTIGALEQSISLGMDSTITIHTPMMWLTKAEEVSLAQSLPGCMDALAHSHTCYNGEFPPCGHCDSCVLRAKGFAEAGIEDPLITRAKSNGLL